MSEIKINNIPVITENNGSVSLTTGTATFTNLDVVGNIKETGGNIELHSNGYTGWKQTNYLGDFYIAHLTNGDAFKINSNGHVTMPYQPMVSALFSNNSGWTNTNTAITIIKFNTVNVNIGNHYNSSTGLFTAPVSGYYQVTFDGLSGNATNHQIHVYIYINGSPYGHVAHWNMNNQGINSWLNLSLNNIIFAAAGDTLSLRYNTNGNGSLYGSAYYTGMSIKLIG